MDVDKTWIPKCVEFLKNVENNNYGWILTKEAKDCKVARLDAVALFCKLSRIFGNYHTFNNEKMKDILLSYKDNNNYYNDTPRTSEWLIAETRQAMSGLINIGYIPDKINLNLHYNNKNNLYFMKNDSHWNDPYGRGAQLSHYLFFCHKNNDNDRIKDVLTKLKRYEKSDGWYYKKCSDTIRINGIMKIFTGLDAINFNYKQIHGLVKGITDSIIKLNPERGGCNIYDYVYVLAKAIDLNYRVDESREKLIKMYNLILTYQQKDGGFSYNIEYSRGDMYGRRIPSGKKIGDIHGTTLYMMSMWIIDKACNLNLNLNTVET